MKALRLGLNQKKNIYCSAIFGGGDWTIKRLQVNYKTENN